MYICTYVCTCDPNSLNGTLAVDSHFQTLVVDFSSNSWSKFMLSTFAVFVLRMTQLRSHKMIFSKFTWELALEEEHLLSSLADLTTS